MISYRRLDENDFEQYHRTLLEAFSNYYVELNPSIESLRRMWIIEGVDFDCSVGAFDGEKMVGFTVNAVSDWNGISAAYDAGTGVIPAYRRRGISRGMFDFILPVLREREIKQYLLEVITENEPAFRLYENLGFHAQRELLVFKRDKIPLQKTAHDFVMREIENPDWNLLESFWTYYPSWQNSIDSVKRSESDKTIIKSIPGVFVAEKLVGYGIVFKNSGSVSQLAVAEEYRGRGFGKALLNEFEKYTEQPLFFTNVDKNAREVSRFLASNGFRLLTSQYEMLLKL